ncbi:MAG: hypothetical protein EOO75_14575, partial [Myxococcales bacterium]
MARSQGAALKKPTGEVAAAGSAATAAGAECEPHDHAHEAPPRELSHSDEAFERAAGIFRAVGDVARLKLLARLA